MGGLDHILKLLLHVHPAAGGLDAGHPGRVGDAHMLGDGRAHLGGVPVGGLLSAKDQVKIPHAADGLGEGIAGGQHVRAGKFPAREQNAGIRSHGHGGAQDLLGLRRAHGQSGDFAFAGGLP
ncbi:hypothetical protein SDC9_187871 [bioreactor metagenome]|uniref:Uncharacterized protein n=1 Tax=bioreactor metagenome TaxID=1076179 RepID=A0A645HMR1_9ZZZZ